MDFLGNLYTCVSDYLWNGSKTYPQVVGLKECGVKPFNYIRWDKESAEARYSKKQEIQPADMPEVVLEMTRIRIKTADSCNIQSEVNFNLSVASGNWKITNATKLYNQIMTLLAVAMHTNEVCHWDIGKPYAIVRHVLIGDGSIGRDKEIRKNQSGFTFEVGFSVQIHFTIHQGEST